MSACKYCLRCAPATIGAVTAFVEGFPNTLPDENGISKLMDNSGMGDWLLMLSSFDNMRYRLTPVDDDELVTLTCTAEGRITCLSTLDAATGNGDTTQVHREGWRK